MFILLQLEKFNTDKYDCNTFDNSGIIGPHPYHNNLILATGFGKLGLCAYIYFL